MTKGFRDVRLPRPLGRPAVPAGGLGRVAGCFEMMGQDGGLLVEVVREKLADGAGRGLVGPGASLAELRR